MVGSAHDKSGSRDDWPEKQCFIQDEELLGGLKSDSGVERVVVNFTEEDQNLFWGTICLLLYIGVWIASALSAPATLILLFLGWYITALVFGVLMGLCYVVPVRPNQRFRQFCRQRLGRYFKQASIRFERVPCPAVDRPTILCISPHGVFSFAWAQCYLTDELHHLRWCFSTMLRLSPFFRVVTQLGGFPSNVRKSTVIKHMQHRRSLALIPGGWHEASIHSPHRDRIYIRKRQGFIKYALQYGYTITPSYAFGERTTYSNIQGCYRFRFWLNGFGILGIVPWGRACCPLFPRPTFIHTVIGTPIELPHIPNPTPEDVDMAHRAYMKAMVELFDRYKVQFYGAEAANHQLELW